MLVRVLALFLGIVFFWQAWLTIQRTTKGIYLTEQGLYDGEGDLICRLNNVKSVDRSMFAFKPTNGFLVRLPAPSRFRWVPGMYWCVGKSVGIGGSTHSTDAKVMADMMSGMIKGQVRRN